MPRRSRSASYELSGGCVSALHRDRDRQATGPGHRRRTHHRSGCHGRGVSVLATLDETVARTGTSLVLISHDLAVVASMTDRIIVMYRGRVVEAGATHEGSGESSPSVHAGAGAACATSPMTAPSSGRSPPRCEPRSMPSVDASDEEDASCALEAVSASKTFRARHGSASVHAVRDASVGVDPGEFVAIVGQSGSGKSTLARCCWVSSRSPLGACASTTHPSPTWTVRRCGCSAETSRRCSRTRPARSTPQDRRHHDRRDHPSARHRLGSQRRTGEGRGVARARRLTPAADFVDRYPLARLSGGQRQQVLIAAPFPSRSAGDRRRRG